MTHKEMIKFAINCSTKNFIVQNNLLIKIMLILMIYKVSTKYHIGKRNFKYFVGYVNHSNDSN